MADDRVAGLKIYSLGIVIQPKVAGSDTIMVSPIEALPMDSGPIRPDSKQVKVSLPDQKGVVKNTEIKGGSTIKAKWIPFGHSNRESAPDVQPSETVILFSYADTQDFYWTTIFREPILRRQETVKYMYSNQPSGQEPYDDDSAYWVLIDTVNKSVQLHTSDNDGEACTYDITMDTKAGSLTIADNLGNSVELDSPAGKLTATTENDVIINTKRFTVNASEKIEFFTPKFLVHAVKTVMNVKEKLTLGYDPSEESDLSTSSTGRFASAGADNHVAIVAQKVTVDTTTMDTIATAITTTTQSESTVSTDVTTTAAMIKTTASVIQEGSMVVTGDTTITGDVKVNGEQENDGDMRVRGHLNSTTFSLG